jgi:hypothetical protein
VTVKLHASQSPNINVLPAQPLTYDVPMSRSRAWLVLACATAGCDQLFQLTQLGEVPVDAPPTRYQGAVLEDHPVAYFRLGELAGVAALDLIAGGPAGTYAGNVVRGAEGALAGDPDAAISLDGTDGAVDLGDTFDFPQRATFSLEAWIRPQFDDDFHVIISKWHSPPENVGYELYYKRENLVISRELGAADYLGYVGLVPDRYSHVVATFDGLMLQLYVDGTEHGRAPCNIDLPDTEQVLFIGAGESPTTVPMLGSIDEVAIYNYALSPQRIFDHFTAAALP